MSASSKKKLRKEQEAAKLTEKQLSAQKEAKKTRVYTAAFIICMAVVLTVAIVVGVRQTITSNGIMEKRTTALTVGSHTLSNAELNYYYMDVVNNYASNYGGYAAMFGLDVSKPLDQQTYNEEEGTTWADYFLEIAKDNARAVYAICDAADAAGYTLSEDGKTSIETAITNMSGYAKLYGFADAKAYLKAIYGAGSTLKDYQAYCERGTLAQEYQTQYSDSLTYSDADLRALESENYDAFSSFTYNTYFISTSRFLTGGTTDENGSTTYSDEERAASVKAAEEAAKTLSAEDIRTVQDLDAAIAALEINKDSEASSIANTDVLYSAVPSTYASWVTDTARKSGDLTCIPSTTTAEDGTETTNGYYIVLFQSKNDNLFPMSNVRHILVNFSGGTTDENGITTYSDEEKAEAKAEAEAILQEWKSGDATEESFAELANTKSGDGDGTTGGLYENINPGSNFVPTFKQWALDEHKSGDTGIIESQYGYHVMYYAGLTEMTYRDFQIENQLRADDTEQWYTETVDAASMTVGNTKYIRTDLVLNSGSAG